MMKLIRRGALVPLALILATSAPRSQAIQLRGGDLLVGEILEATSEGLSFRRLDNGGLLVLNWSDLSPLHAARIKRLQGLVVDEEGDPTVEADVITFAPPGAALIEVIGIIEQQTPTHYTIRRKHGTLEIRRETIKSKRRVDVPASELYTESAWYELKLAETAPGEDPDSHVLLAEQMRLARNWDMAEKHLVEAERLGGGRQAGVLPQMLQRIRTLKEAAAERELLARIRVMRNRGEFEKAETLIAEFTQTYPDSRIQADFETEVRRVGEARDRDLVDRLRQNWDRTVRAVAVEKVAERGLTLAAARTYAEEKMTDDVFSKLSKALGAEPQELRDFWGRRAEFGKRSSELATYGLGSWLLGADRVVAGTRAEGGGSEKNKPAASSQDQELERMIRRMREAADRARRAAQARTGQGEEEETDESWWADAPHDDKESWLRAFYFEFGGQMEIVLAVATPCHNCAGRGTVLSVGTTGREVQAACPVCHRTRFVRSVRAR